MGCCQANSEAGEIYLPNFQGIDLQQEKYFRSEGEFAELSLESHSEETEFNPRYTEQPKINECIVTFRSTSYSLHRTELEQSFLQSNLSSLNPYK